MILDEILASKSQEIKALKSKTTLTAYETKARAAAFRPRPFKQALQGPANQPRFILELKKASPSEGILRNEFKPLELAKQFEAEGASAISVLTESQFFMGERETPKRIRPFTRIPLLRKDFIVDPFQIFETVLLEADSFLLIVLALKTHALRELIELGHEFGLEPLVEVHSELELDRAFEAGAKIIGINTRDLTTLKIHRELPIKLLKKVPSNLITVIESGIESHEDVQYYQAYGAQCFLIGSTLMKARDISAKMKELRGIKE
jgi:indole-3-glycerol phosphate synthase